MNLLQRQVAKKLDIDTPMLSKLERGERKARRDQVVAFSKILKIKKEELLTLWLADQVSNVLSGEDLAKDALKVAEQYHEYRKTATKA